MARRSGCRSPKCTAPSSSSRTCPLFYDFLHPNDDGYRFDHPGLLRRDHQAAVHLLRPRGGLLLSPRPPNRPAYDGPHEQAACSGSAGPSGHVSGPSAWRARRHRGRLPPRAGAGSRPRPRDPRPLRRRGRERGARLDGRRPLPRGLPRDEPPPAPKPRPSSSSSRSPMPCASHARGVEAAMQRQDDSDRRSRRGREVGIVGLLHDFDYEQNPTEETHLHVGCRILRERGLPEEIVEAIGPTPTTWASRATRRLEALFGCDELVGFIGAAVKVRPTKKVADLPVESGHEEAQGQGLRPLRGPRLRLRRGRGPRPASRGARGLRDRGARADRRRDRSLAPAAATAEGHGGHRWPLPRRDKRRIMAAMASLVQDVWLGWSRACAAFGSLPGTSPACASSSTSTPA